MDYVGLFKKAEMSTDIEMKYQFLDQLLHNSSKGIEYHYNFFVQTDNYDLKKILGKGLLEWKESLVPFLLIKLANTSNDLELANILHLIGLTYNHSYLNIVLPYIQSDNYDIRYKAIIAIGWLGDANVFPLLKNLFYKEKEIDLKSFCITSMEQIIYALENTEEEQLELIKEDLVYFIVEVIVNEHNKTVLEVCVSAVQEILEVDFGLFFDIDTGSISGDVYQAKIKFIDYINEKRV